MNKAPETREAAVVIFDKFIRQRPGFDWRNYCSGWQEEHRAGIAAYRADVRTAGKQRLRALRALEIFSYLLYDPEALIHSMDHAYSGRLQFDSRGELTYCAGQYMPTEYRQAVAVCLETYNRRVRGL